MKKLSFLFLLTLLPLMASAQTLINGIYYNFNTETKQATVTYRSFGGYAGNVNIPESVTYNGVNYVVTSIEAGAFYDCVDLTSVTIPSNVTEIGNSAFEGCSGLTSLEIPNGVTFIGTDAFTGTAWLDNQPEGLLYIGKVVYKYIGTMPENTSISLKEGTTAIVGKAFHECSGLISIDIPNTVTSIGMGAFTYCSSLTSVIIPQGVTSIGMSAFNSCYSLASVSIPNSVTSIGSGSFYKCKALTEIVIPNGVTEIGSCAFQNCSNLTSVIIGNSVTLLNNSAFSGCSRLTDVYCYAENVPSTGSEVFTESTIRSTTLYVPALALENYKNSEPWSRFGNIVALDDEQVVEDVAINETNFPDEIFRNWVLSQSYGADGVLTDEEIATVTKIDVSGMTIKSLKGIENFTALTTLWCYGTFLTSLDISKNTALTELQCHSNQLTFLDVSHNTALEELHCFSNKITTLDVSKNTALKMLSCSSNQLTSLDVSKNLALTGLTCSNNQLTSLDVSKNTALIGLTCSDNQLTTLDISINTAMTNLYCGNNQLTSLDVSNNTAMKDLYCQENQITSLDLSKNTVLRMFNCSNNKLTSLDVLNKTRLRELRCYSNQLTSLDVSGCKILSKLECYINNIKGAGMDALIESLPNVSNGTMNLIYHTGEQNIISATQVATAKEKGWTPYYCDLTYNEEYDFYYDDWFECTGSEPEPMKKCATPTISLVNDKLEFECETEGVEFVSKVTCPDPGEYEGSSIPLTTTYTVTVYAKKEGYENSDVATAEINVGGGETGVRGDVNLDGEIGMPDVMFIVNYILNGKFPDE